jgi:hypothetical protein
MDSRIEDKKHPDILTIHPFMEAGSFVDVMQKQRTWENATPRGRIQILLEYDRKQAECDAKYKRLEKDRKFRMLLEKVPLSRSKTMENPYMGKDGRDYHSREALKAANDDYNNRMLVKI